MALARWTSLGGATRRSLRGREKVLIWRTTFASLALELEGALLEFGAERECEAAMVGVEGRGAERMLQLRTRRPAHL